MMNESISILNLEGFLIFNSNMIHKKHSEHIFSKQTQHIRQYDSYKQISFMMEVI